MIARRDDQAPYTEIEKADGQPWSGTELYALRSCYTIFTHPDHPGVVVFRDEGRGPGIPELERLLGHDRFSWHEAWKGTVKFRIEPPVTIELLGGGDIGAYSTLQTVMDNPVFAALGPEKSANLFVQAILDGDESIRGVDLYERLGALYQLTEGGVAVKGINIPRIQQSMAQYWMRHNS